MVIEKDKIVSIGEPGVPCDVDAEGKYLVTGFVDVHTHGAMNEDFSDGKADCSVALQALREGKLPLRVTHNDTKLSNVLIDEDT